jgi:hypothetical protein
LVLSRPPAPGCLGFSHALTRFVRLRVLVGRKLPKIPHKLGIGHFLRVHEPALRLWLWLWLWRRWLRLRR